MKNEKTVVRPTKKQRELLTYIEQFIAANGYSPSYREIRDGLKYTSVATVALRVNSLIKRGHLKKRDHSARSLEVVKGISEADFSTNEVKETEEKWLVTKVKHFFKTAEDDSQLTQPQLDELYVLIGALIL